MKISVTPEGREGIYLPNKESLISWIKEQKFEQIHNFIAGPMMLGADWDTESVLDHIRESERLGIMTGDSLKNNMRHALAAIKSNELYMFDIGEITSENLLIK